MSDMTFHPVQVDEAGGLAATAPETHIEFGVTFNLRGQLIPVRASDITNAKKNGLELTLPSAVKLGSFNDFTAWFKKQFNIDIPSADELPPPLDQVIGKLASLEVTVSTAHVKVPPADPAGQPTLYTLLLTAEWPAGETGIPLIPGVLTIDGGVFGVSNEPPKPPAGDGS